MNADSLSRRPCYQSACKCCLKLEEKDDLSQMDDNTDETNETKDGVTRGATAEEEHPLQIWTREELMTMQMRDPDIGPVVKWKSNGRRPEWREVSALSAATK